MAQAWNERKGSAPQLTQYGWLTLGQKGTIAANRRQGRPQGLGRVRNRLAMIQQRSTAVPGLDASPCSLELHGTGERRPVLEGNGPSDGRFQRIRVLGLTLERWRSWEPALYAAVTAVWILAVAQWFYGSMRWQLYHSIAWAQGVTYDPAQRLNVLGLWSAPLDDTFIHFDFARSTARGFPFQWIDGNGYSSGGTSLLYPFVLALGMLAGFRGLLAMHFAALLATTCVFAAALGLRRAFTGLPKTASYLLPFALLGVGGLGWSIFSGMELALLLAVWTGAVRAQDALSERVLGSAVLTARHLVPLALWNVALVATRPEALTTAGILACAVSWHFWRRLGLRRAITVLAATTFPAASVTFTQAIANRILTGDFAAAGALVKLEMYSPHMTWRGVAESYFAFLKYQVVRVTELHFSSEPYLGLLVWALAGFALVPKPTRRWALLLWASLVTWIATVALNGQVRWQNERYTMPAVAFLLIAAALGAGALITMPLSRGLRQRRNWGAFAVGAAALGTFVTVQKRCMADQVWFFGRASRNVFDQQLQVGHRLGHLLHPVPRRIAMGDAGAIPYAADVPGLDLIGLGGTHRLPFARAAGWGLGATVELIQRLPKADRPDVLAIYPSWWNDLPLWFSDGVIESASSTARGNVICGGPTKVGYRADFSALDDAETPLSLEAGERVVDALDFADIVSERLHDYEVSNPCYSYVGMKMLPDPRNPQHDVWDASRIVDPGLTQTFVLRGLRAGHPLKLVFRSAPPMPQQMRVSVQYAEIGELALRPSDSWVEPTIEVSAEHVKDEVTISLTTAGRTAAELFHVWAVQAAH